jgi:hypothetical protein
MRLHKVPCLPRNLPLFCTIVAVLISLRLSAQISGHITDPSGQFLAFVSILPNDEPGKVVISDIEGRFRINTGTGIHSLVFRYVGFETLRLDSSYLAKHAGKPLQIVLHPADNTLPEAIIHAGENPADVLIRKAIARRHLNNPEEYASFVCNTYNKINFDLIPNRAAYEKLISRRDTSRKEFRESKQDFTDLEKAMQEHHALMVETVTERSFKPPNSSQERVLLNRVSGFKDMGIVAIANAFQPFAFYGDYLHILDRDFVNPISPGSPNLYFFQIEDTLFIGRDTIWVISFKPHRGKVFDALEGVIQLNSDGWAIQNVRAHPFLPSDNLQLRIEQSYQKLDTAPSRPPSTVNRQPSLWFPEQLNFEIEMMRYPDPTRGMRLIGRSFVKNAKIGVPLKAKNFLPDMPIFIDPKAASSQQADWDQWRKMAPLTKKEARTFEWMDSLTQREKLGFLNHVFNYVSTGRAYVGKGLSLDLKHLIRFNQFEKVRLGVGLTTAESRPLYLPKTIEFGAFAGYGFGDKGWKYGGYGLWRIAQPTRTQLQVGWKHDIQEPGALYELSKSEIVNRAVYAKRMDYNTESSVSIRSNLWHGAHMSATFRQQNIRPGYDYQFGPPDGPLSDRFRFTEGTLYLRYAVDERTKKFLGEDIYALSKIPVLHL